MQSTLGSNHINWLNIPSECGLAGQPTVVRFLRYVLGSVLNRKQQICSRDRTISTNGTSLYLALMGLLPWPGRKPAVALPPPGGIAWRTDIVRQKACCTDDRCSLGTVT